MFFQIVKKVLFVIFPKTSVNMYAKWTSSLLARCPKLCIMCVHTHTQTCKNLICYVNSSTQTAETKSSKGLLRSVVIGKRQRSDKIGGYMSGQKCDFHLGGSSCGCKRVFFVFVFSLDSRAQKKWYCKNMLSLRGCSLVLRTRAMQVWVACRRDVCLFQGISQYCFHS